MSAREPELNPATPDDGARIALALRRLPVGEPPADGWTRLRARLEHREPRRALAPTLAIAASALLVSIGLLLRPGAPEERASSPEVRATASAMPLDAAALAPRGAAEWRVRSQQLERLLAGVPEPNVVRTGTGLTTAMLEDRIARIDERLNELPAARASAPDADALWRERVLLLDSLVRVRYAAAVDPGI